VESLTETEKQDYKDLGKIKLENVSTSQLCRYFELNDKIIEANRRTKK